MKKAVFTFGRMNPPTVGHQKLVDKVASVAKQQNAMPHVYLSHSQNAKKDPLDYQTKMKYAKKAFGKAMVSSSARTIIEVLQELEKMGHTDITMVVGSDRVQSFKDLLNKYNGKDYNFNSINVMSAGQRDPDAEGVTGMSASKMRQLASTGQFNQFKKGVPSGLTDRDAQDLYNKIRSTMGINEAKEFDLTEDDVADILKQINLELMDDEDLEDLGVDMVHFIQTMDDEEEEEELDEVRQPLTLLQRRKLAMRMKRLAPKMARLRKLRSKRMAPMDRLQMRARKQAIKLLRKRAAGKKGEEYATLTPAAKITIDKLIMKKRPLVAKIAQRLLPKVRKAEMERLKKARTPKNEAVEVRQDQDIAKRAGTQPAKYFKDLSKSTKVARDAHFKKGKEASDSDPSAYKPAPGDARAETKPSKHTTKFKDMFGEQQAVDRAKERIRQEREAEKRRDAIDQRAQDRRLDRARMQDTLAKNRKTDKARVQTEEVDGKQLVHHGQKTKNFDICPGALKAFDQNQKDGMGDKEGFHDAVVAVDMYLGLEKRLMNKDTVTQKDFNTMKDMVNDAKSKIRQAGLPGHNYHQIHIDAVKNMMKNVTEAKRGRPTKVDDPDNFIMQLRSIADLDKGEVIFRDGSKATISKNIAMHAVNKYNQMKKPADKLKFMRSMHRNLKSFKKSLMANYQAQVTDPNPEPAFNRYRTSMISGSMKVENAIQKASDINETFEMYEEANAKQLKAFSVFKQDPTASPISSVVPRDNYLLEKDMDALKKKAEKSGIPYSILKKVYDRGMAAWKTGHRPGTTPHQWAFARVNSFATKSKGTWGGADKDLAAKVRSEEAKLDEISPELKKRYTDKAKSDQKFHQYSADTAKKMGPYYKDAEDYYANKAKKRAAGIRRANESYEVGTDHSVDHTAGYTPGQNPEDIKNQIKEANPKDPYGDVFKKMGFKKYDPKKYEKSPEERARIKKAQDAATKKAAMDTAKKARSIAKQHGHKIPAGHEHVYLKGYEHGQKGYEDRKAGDVYGPKVVSYDKGQEAGRKKPVAESLDESFQIALGTGYSAAPTAQALGIGMQGGFAYHPSVEEQVHEQSCGCNPEPIEEAEYQGKSVKLNDPIRTSEVPSKKFKVYVKDPATGNIKVVRFGDPNLSIKRDDPDRRKSFRARHNCDNPGPKTKARYWSCYQWRAGAKVDN